MDFTVSIKTEEGGVENYLLEEDYRTLSPAKWLTASHLDETNSFDKSNSEFEAMHDVFDAADVPNDIEVMRSAYSTPASMEINSFSNTQHYLKQDTSRIKATNQLQGTEQAYNNNFQHAKSLPVNRDVAVSIHRNLREHPKTQLICQRKPHICNYCNKAYIQKSHLQIHIMVHTGEKPYACSHCDKAFIQKGDLQRHSMTHTGEKPFACTQCDKTFRQKGNLQSHMMVHTRKNPYFCSQCDVKFTQKCSFLKHVKTHSQRHSRTQTGKKPFACCQCDKTFTKKMHLLSHILIHAGEKPHFCSQCDMTFTQNSSLQRHVKTDSHRRKVLSLYPI